MRRTPWPSSTLTSFGWRRFSMSCLNESLANRDIRQRDLVPPEQLERCDALVIGVGAIGRQVASQLAAIGIAVLSLVDHDVVAVENLAAQGYWPLDLRKFKVDVTADLCRQ